MKSLWAIPLALGFVLVLGSESAAQFGRPSFVPRPRFTPAPRTPVIPHPMPVTPRPTRMPGTQQTTALRSAASGMSATQAASTVGLLASPLGQGPLLEAATLLDAQIRAELPRQLLAMLDTSRPTPMRMARMVALLASPWGQGPLLESSTRVVEQTDAEENLRQWLETPPSVRKLKMLAENLNPIREQVENAVEPVPAKPAEKDSDWSSWILISLALLAGALSLLAKALRTSEDSSAARTRVRILSVPPGDAPRSIREAWIGLELPLARGQQGSRSEHIFGVLSQRSEGRCNGYAVNGAEAVQLLAGKDSRAAGWWRENAPHVLTDGYQLWFPAEVCKEIG